ncbi:hypothetical protein RZS08_42045, partial [Arthrospira platensis SPKY1]|nr:hypothetical protein [Arthrospira platensis SPKY1]
MHRESDTLGPSTGPCDSLEPVVPLRSTYLAVTLLGGDELLAHEVFQIAAGGRTAAADMLGKFARGQRHLLAA